MGRKRKLQQQPGRRPKLRLDVDALSARKLQQEKDQEVFPGIPASFFSSKAEVEPAPPPPPLPASPPPPPPSEDPLSSLMLNYEDEEEGKTKEDPKTLVKQFLENLEKEVPREFWNLPPPQLETQDTPAPHEEAPPSLSAALVEKWRKKAEHQRLRRQEETDTALREANEKKINQVCSRVRSSLKKLDTTKLAAEFQTRVLQLSLEMDIRMDDWKAHAITSKYMLDKLSVLEDKVKKLSDDLEKTESPQAKDTAISQPLVDYSSANEETAEEATTVSPKRQEHTPPASEAVEAKAAAQEEIVAAAAPVSTTKAWSGVLPSGWYAVYDENYHAYYYANMRTGETTWTIPVSSEAMDRHQSQQKPVTPKPVSNPKEEEIISAAPTLYHSDNRATHSETREELLNKTEPRQRVLPSRSKPDRRTASLMEKWRHVGKTIEFEDKATDPETLRQKEFEKWRLEQIRSGAASYNPNFLPIFPQS